MLVWSDRRRPITYYVSVLVGDEYRLVYSGNRTRAMELKRLLDELIDELKKKNDNT